MTEAPPCPPHHPPQPLADRQWLRCRHRHAQGLRWCALLAALAAIAAPGAWARAAAAKPASVASPSAASAASAAAVAAPAGSAGSAVAAVSAPAARSAARFGFYGLSPAQAGQALAQAETALGQPLTAEAAAKPIKPAAAGSAAADCHYRSTAQQPGVRYALAGAVITRIETRDPRYATFSGVHVGDSLARAQQAYGQRLVSAPHPYFDQGRLLTVYSPDRRFALVMETNDGGRIITLRGGRLPDVGWLEGCS